MVSIPADQREINQINQSASTLCLLSWTQEDNETQEDASMATAQQHHDTGSSLGETVMHSGCCSPINSDALWVVQSLVCNGLQAAGSLHDVRDKQKS